MPICQSKFRCAVRRTNPGIRRRSLTFRRLCSSKLFIYFLLGQIEEASALAVFLFLSFFPYRARLFRLILFVIVFTKKKTTHVFLVE